MYDEYFPTSGSVRGHWVTQWWRYLLLLTDNSQDVFQWFQSFFYRIVSSPKKKQIFHLMIVDMVSQGWPRFEGSCLAYHAHEPLLARNIKGNIIGSVVSTCPPGWAAGRGRVAAGREGVVEIGGVVARMGGREGGKKGGRMAPWGML